MVIDKILKMTVKGVKLKSESFFVISPGVLGLWRKNLRGERISPPWIGLTLRIPRVLVIIIIINFIRNLNLQG